MTEQPSRWLAWAREIQALAETSLHYADNPFERERAERLIEIAAEIVAAYSKMSTAEAYAAFSAQPGYVTPKVDVRGAVFRDEQLLMVREAIDGGWTLPGGWADVGETPRIAVEREVFEESGIQVRAQSLVGIYDANRIEGELSLFHAYKLVFLCESVAGELSTSDETFEVGFFHLNALPSPFSAYRTTQRHIEDSIAAFRNPARIAGFD